MGEEHVGGGEELCRWVGWEGQRALSLGFTFLCLMSLGCEGLCVRSVAQGLLVTHRSSGKLDIE